MKITAHTRVFAVLGDPIAQSLSPRMQNAGFQAAGLDAVYVALRPTEASLVAQMCTLVRDGGGGNVTVPFKQVAASAPAVRDARVELLQAANVFAATPGGMQVGNTDVDGILAALDQLHAPAGAWCIIGTGGSARAVVGAAIERGASIAVQSREPTRAASFSGWAASLGVLPADVSECRVVINTTPLGLTVNDRHPCDGTMIPPDAVVLDLVYRHDGPTPWVRACSARGIAARDGREVLLAQGAASWRFWFPGVDPPVEVMRAALNGQVG